MGSKSQTQTTTASPFAPAIPLIKDVIGATQNEFNNNPAEFFPGQTFVDPSQQRIDALDQSEALARGGNPLLGGAINFAQGALASGPTQAQQLLGATARGDFLNGNPILDRLIDAQANKTADQVNSAFSAAGRFGSPAQAGTLADRLGQVRLGITNENFQNERGRQIGAANSIQAAELADRASKANIAGNLVPGLDAARFSNADRLAAIGGQREAIDQQGLNEQLARFDFEQNGNLARLGNFAGLAAGLGGVGGTQTQTNTSKSSPAGTILGALGALGSLAFPPAAALSFANPIASGTLSGIGGQSGGLLGRLF